VLLYETAFVAPGQRKLGEMVSLVALRDMSIESIVAIPSRRNDDTACVQFRGKDGVLVKLADDGKAIREASRSRSGAICFESVEAAERAAKALVHLAGLCAASDRPNPS
jgi:hypothetical protein